MRYLRRAATSASSFAVVWLWVATMPMAFMDAEYPSWRAKQVLTERCDLGETIILGDSRAAADIMPRRLPFRATISRLEAAKRSRLILPWCTLWAAQASRPGHHLDCADPFRLP